MSARGQALIPVDGLAPFAAALLQPAAPTPSGLVTWNGSDPRVRFNVYRNNVAVSLGGALAETFPVVRALVGAAFFDALARAFIAAAPPRSPVLTDYGDGFAGFIANFAPAAGLAYLPDLARLEWARLRAWHAADQPALETAQLSARLAEPAGLPMARIGLHPSVSVLRSDFAVVSLWAAHQHGGRIGEVVLVQSEAALILRAGDDALVVPIATATADLFVALAEGQPLGAAVAAAGAGLDLAASLALLIGQRAICAWAQPDEPRQ